MEPSLPRDRPSLSARKSIPAIFGSLRSGAFEGLRVRKWEWQNEGVRSVYGWQAKDHLPVATDATRNQGPEGAPHLIFINSWNCRAGG